MGGILQDLSSGDRLISLDMMFSRVIHVVPHVRIPFFFKAE